MGQGAPGGVGKEVGRGLDKIVTLKGQLEGKTKVRRVVIRRGQGKQEWQAVAAQH